MVMTNRQITLAARPKGVPKESDFALVETPVPDVGDGQVLVRNNYISVDPYMRGLIAGRDHYLGSVGVGDVVPGRSVGTVVASRHPDFREGDVVRGPWGWQDCVLCDSAGLTPVDVSLGPISTALGVLGMPGMTAYFGLIEVGRPKAGESVFVSGAAGAVGSAVGQIAKINGCRVAGSAGSDEKVRVLLDEFAFDAAFNYREVKETRYRAKIKEVCPDGVDVYFDNVGGPLTDAVFNCINVGARIVLCGQIAHYNDTRPAEGPRLLRHLIVKQARAEGIMVYQFQDRFAEGHRQMAQWLKEGKLKYRETIVDGIENTPRAFIGLFRGENIGKQLVRTAAE